MHSFSHSLNNIEAGIVQGAGDASVSETNNHKN